MMTSLGWIIVLLGVIFAHPGILWIVEAIEADDPTNPAVINGYHYPAAVFMFAFLISPLLVIFSALSIVRKEPSRFLSLVYGVPALGVLAVFIIDIFSGPA